FHGGRFYLRQLYLSSSSSPVHYTAAMRIRRRVTIQAPPETVWDVITDLRRAVEWAPAFDDYPFISPQWPQRGAQATWRYHFGPLSFNFALTITESQRGKGLQIANRSLFGQGLEVYSFTASGGITTVWYDFSDEPNLLGRLVTPLFEERLIKQMDATMANLKDYCERKVKAASS
ncbi:MAG: SRPBCC family protein, partial [Candidatus Binatia bacterium]